MFTKPFKVKSCTQIKSSEKKSLKELILKKFPVLTEADTEDILPKKETAFCYKVFTATNKHVYIYSVQKRPILFSVDDLFYPTIYLLWRYPQLGIEFTTNDFVISKILQGADLMMPGLYNNPAKRISFLGKQVGVINNVTNRAAVAVGAIAMSSTQMLAADKGKCVLVYHCHGDKLCSMDEMSILSVPDLGPAMIEFGMASEALNSDNIEVSPSEEQEHVENNIEITEGLVPVNELKALSVDNDLSDVEKMDLLLEKCFLTAIKYSKTLEIPILTSSFYKLEMIAVCPPDKTLDVKKSSYKKVGQFLNSMATKGLILIKEEKKGVETITNINKAHEDFVNFYLEIDNRPRKQEQDDESTSCNVTESFSVTAAVLPVFKQFGIGKGETMTTTEIRKYITNYVRDRNLQDDNNKRFVNVSADPALQAICKNERSVTWEDLMAKTIGSMKSCFKISTGDAETMKKGKVQPIIMTTHTRSGNKKVTIVDNLELYHIKLGEFAKECQHGVAASTSISRPSGKKTDQILIQGNQVLFVYNLLTDKYKIPKKYIRGLENAPKSKK